MPERAKQETISPSGWTVDTLKALMDERDRRYLAEIASIKEAMGAALVAVRETTQETKHQTDKWQTSANEWRGAMGDREDRFVHKEHLNPMIDSLQREVDELKTVMNLNVGKTMGMEKFWGYIVAAAGSGGVAAFLLDKIVTK